MNKALDDMGATPKVARFQIQAHWPEIVGPEMARHSQPQKLQNRCLFVTTSGPVWSQEIMMRQGNILQALSIRFSKLKIDNLRCRVGVLRSMPEAQAKEKPVDLSKIQLPASSEHKVRQLADEVQDPDLKKSLLRALRQQEKRNLWLIQQGAIACQNCGALQNLRFCLGCQQEARREKRQRLFQLLGREPWITAQEVVERLPGVTQSEFHTARKQLLSIWRMGFYNQRDHLKEGQPLPGGLRQLFVDICMLSTATPWDQLQERHIRFSLGRIWAKAYLEDKAPPPYQKKEVSP